MAKKFTEKAKEIMGGGCKKKECDCDARARKAAKTVRQASHLDAADKIKADFKSGKLTKAQAQAEVMKLIGSILK